VPYGSRLELCGYAVTQVTLPQDERQVKEYELHLQRSGHPLMYARAAIAKHGFGAADLACDRLATSDPPRTGARTGATRVA
jgi:hypothetical protein